MPRFRSIGFMPAATGLAPSRTIEAARTVAVVVPSPAMSLDFEATSRTIWAPMFSNLSDSSISFATVTPSLVMRGAPNDFSMTTLRPLGPRVTFTASARTLTPLRIAVRAPSEKRSSFADIIHCLLISKQIAESSQDAEDVFLAHHEILIAFDLDLGTGVLTE